MNNDELKKPKTGEIEEDDIVLENNEESGRDAAVLLKKLKEKLAAAEKEKQEYLDGWQRAKAELVNARKRDAERHDEYRTMAVEGIIDELIPVLQSFDMAMANKEVWEKVEKNWRVGVEYIYQQLSQVLSKNGLKELSPLGQTFDPQVHEATGFVPVAEKEKNNIIVAIIQKGYELNGHLVRAPKVQVGEYTEPQA
jgi:molecular chaperone GrpE